MNSIRRLSLIGVAASLALVPSVRADPQQPTPANEPPTQLEPGRTVERDISARQVHTFRVALDSGSLVRVAPTQRGIDLVVSIYGPDGAKLAEADSSADGPEQEARAVARRTGDHRVEIRAFDTTAAPGRYGVTVVEILSAEQVAALSAADRARYSATVSWLAANAVRLRGVEAGHGFDDMEPLRGMVGGARVVALGEATHGTREFFELKHRMLEFLVTRMGFNVFAIEATMPEAFEVNEYVLTGRGDPGKALSALYFWTWNTDEVLDMIRWMRRYDADPHHARKVKFYGFDMQAPTRALRAALGYLRHVDPQEARAGAASLADLADSFLASSLTSLPGGQRDSLLPAARRLLARFDERRDAYVRRSSTASWALARQHARILVQNLETAAAGDSGFGVRDRSMAENVGWILQREGPGAKAVLWAHNGHVASNCAPPVWMGCHLRRSLGRDLVIFGFAFNRGGFQAVEMPFTAQSRLRSFEVGPAPDSSLDATLVRAGLSLAAVDLRAAPDGPVAEWLAQPHLTRSIGAGYGDQFAAAFLQSEAVRSLYDALFFVDSTSAAHPRPGGTRPPRDVLATPTNLDFEERTSEGRPRQWYVAPNVGDFGFTVASTAARPYRGKWSVVVARAPGHHYGETNGGLGQLVDAGAYRGKWVRLRAMSRVEVRGENSRAHLWLMLERRSNLLGPDSLRERTVTLNAWRPYEMVVYVPENIATIRYGFTLVGDGRAWIDDVSLEVVPQPHE